MAVGDVLGLFFDTCGSYGEYVVECNKKWKLVSNSRPDIIKVETEMHFHIQKSSAY